MTTTYPGGLWRPLGKATQYGLARHDIVCVHTMVGSLTGTDAYFRSTSTSSNSHFGVGGAWGPDRAAGLDGAVWQWVDLEQEAYANYEGNWRVVSVETADNGVRPIEPWTARQMATLTRLITWLCGRYDIPPVLVPDTQVNRRGLAYHAQGAAEHTAGEWWSATRSKDCPTSSRIDQFKHIVIPRVQQALAPKPTEEDMGLIIVRADGHGPLVLTDGFKRRNISNTERAGWATAGVRELNLTGAPDSYDEMVSGLEPA